MKNILEPDEETYNDYYIYDINFEYDNRKYDKIKIYKFRREDFMICRDSVSFPHVLKVYNKETDFVNALYEYFKETYSDYFNAIDMGLL